MIRISPAFTLIAFTLIFVSCKKDYTQPETVLSGTWIKGTNAGDTLQFMRKNNKNILRYNMSFNTTLAAFTEVEYTYQDGKLGIKLYSPTLQDFYPINSFTWRQVGSEFEIHGIELFPILSSTQVYFTYRKI
jgi:hypothetical protein